MPTATPEVQKFTFGLDLQRLPGHLAQTFQVGDVDPIHQVLVLMHLDQAVTIDQIDIPPIALSIRFEQIGDHLHIQPYTGHPEQLALVIVKTVIDKNGQAVFRRLVGIDHQIVGLVQVLELVIPDIVGILGADLFLHPLIVIVKPGLLGDKKGREKPYLPLISCR